MPGRNLLYTLLLELAMFMEDMMLFEHILGQIRVGGFGLTPSTVQGDQTRKKSCTPSSRIRTSDLWMSVR